jgi:hypothetical protein
MEQGARGLIAFVIASVRKQSKSPAAMPGFFYHLSQQRGRAILR